ncbi:hypothetical protein [Sandaracinus amylolyticus]|uniref:hypothetical protein n=1 Tax=Sandaracinus amylolyticus TaxID=927083 RepID=UPI001F27C876|nr:hypothetical protein [Sandaracinus amylolyticus]UJR84181.1 Hypothetical protein I5071_62520 [Sandaracinus amylolyticus]
MSSDRVLQFHIGDDAFDLKLPDASGGLAMFNVPEHPDWGLLDALLQKAGVATSDPFERRVAFVSLLANLDEGSWALASELIALSTGRVANALLNPPPGERDSRWHEEYASRVIARPIAMLALHAYVGSHAGVYPDDRTALLAFTRSMWFTNRANPLPSFADAEQQSKSWARAGMHEGYAEWAKHARLVDPAYPIEVPAPRRPALAELLFDGLSPHDPDQDVIDIDWRALQGSSAGYFAPSVRIELTGDPSARTVKAISVAFHGTQHQRYEPSAGAAWQYAEHCARTALLLDGQLRGHLGRGHVVTEVYRRAVDAMFEGDAQSPVFSLLRPFLRSVVEIDDLGVPLVFGEGSILAVTSGLAAEAFGTVLTEVLERNAWSTWVPPTPHPSSRYRRAGAAFARGVDAFLEAWFEANDAAIRAHWGEIERFHAAIGHARRAPAGRPWSAGPVPPIARVDDLRKLVHHAIYHATFFHTWANDQQWDVGGDPAFAAFALRAKSPPEPEYADWLERAAPERGDALMQCLLADVLSNTKYGRWVDIDANPERYVRRSPDDPAVLDEADHAILVTLMTHLQDEEAALGAADFELKRLRLWVAI